MKHALLKRIVHSQSFAFLALVLLGVFGYTHVSYADNLFTEGLLGAAGGLAGFFAHWAVVLVNTLAAKVLQVIAFLMDFGLQLNASVITNGIVPIGWKIARDIANFGFTIGLILISFATILRSQQYSAKKLLGKLIIVALLINFSLLIPGVILDGAHVFSNFFLSKIIGGEGGRSGLAVLSESLANSMNLQGFANINAGADNALSVENIADVIKIIVGGLFVIFFQVFAAIAMGAVAFMVLFRYLILTFLLIVAPLAWISLFLPAFGNQWSKWWETFFKWAFFLPFMTFFLYLSIFAATHNVFTSTINNASGIYANINDIKDIIAVAAQMTVLIGLIFGSLMVAQKMGIAGAGAALGFATGARKFMLGAITKGAVGAVAGPAKYLGARPLKAGAMGLASLLNRPALRWIPGAKGAVAGLSGFGKRQDEVEAYRKQYLSNLSNEQLHQTTKAGIINKLVAKIPYVGKVLTTSLIDSPVDTAATLSEHIKRKQLSKLFEDVKDDPKKKAAMVELFAAAAQKVNPGTDAKDIEEVKALLGFKPTLTPKITGGKYTVYEGARKFTSADKAPELDIDEVKSMSVISSLTENHWEEFIKNPSTPTEVLIGAQNTLEELVGPELVKLQQEYAFAQMQIDRAKAEGVPENDVIALDDKGRKIKGADGKFIVAQKGLKTMKREKNVELNKRRDELFRNASTITAKDRENYTDVIKGKRMDEPNFIENIKKQFKALHNRELSDDELNDQLIFIARGQAYKQLEDMKKRVGGVISHPYLPKGGGGALPPGGPTAGGAPAAPRTVPEMMGELKAKREKEAREAEAKTKAEVEAKRAAAGTAGFLGEMSEAEERADAAREERIEAQRKEGDKDEGLPPPSLPGTRPPTPQPSQPSTPAPTRPATPTPPTQPTQVPPRAPTSEPERPATPPPIREETVPPARPATATPPSEATTVPPRAPTRATAEQSVEAEAKRRAEREEAARAATQAREEEETRAEAAKKTAEAAKETATAAKETTAAEEAGLKAAEKAAEEELKAREAALGVTKKTEEETKKILREVEGGAEAIEKILENVNDLTDNPNRWIGKTIITPDGSKRTIRKITPLDKDPDNGFINFSTVRAGETIPREDILTISQLKRDEKKAGKKIKIIE